jgi:hypothetical protein
MKRLLATFAGGERRDYTNIAGSEPDGDVVHRGQRILGVENNTGRGVVEKLGSDVRLRQMLGEYTNDFSFGDRGSVEYVRSHPFDLVAKLLKLDASIARMSFPAVTSQINESGRAYCAFHRRVSIKHGEFIRHPLHVVTHVLPPRERHSCLPKNPHSDKTAGF